MNFLNEAAFAYCSVRKKKKKMELIWKNRDWPLSVSHIHSLPPTLIDDLPVSPFFLKTSYQLQILGL